LVIDFEESNLLKKMKIATSTNYNNDFKSTHNIVNSSSYKFEDKLKIEKVEKKYITKISYRPFDIREIYYRIGFTSRPAGEITKHLINNNNLGLITTRQYIENDLFSHAFVFNIITDVRITTSNRGTAYLFPLYLYPDSNSLDQERKPNFTDDFNKYLNEKKLDNKTPEEILGYIYSILYSPTYRTKYYEFLKIDFPRIPFEIPLTPDLSRGLWNQLSELGQRLIDLHLLKTEFDKNIVSFPVAKPDLKVTKVEYKPLQTSPSKGEAVWGQVWFNDTTYFDNVPQNVWDYYIGGYQVLDKWLKERKKHEYILTGEDLRHFIKVCNVLAETIEIQGKIDELTRDWV